MLIMATFLKIMMKTYAKNAQRAKHVLALEQDSQPVSLDPIMSKVSDATDYARPVNLVFVGMLRIKLIQETTVIPILNIMNRKAEIQFIARKE
jgi:hypothetical protein